MQKVETTIFINSGFGDSLASSLFIPAIIELQLAQTNSANNQQKDEIASKNERKAHIAKQIKNIQYIQIIILSGKKSQREKSIIIKMRKIIENQSHHACVYKENEYNQEYKKK